MPKIGRKFIFLGMLAVVAAALIATLAIPALAANLKGGRPGAGPGVPPNTNFATVQGALTVSGSSVVVTPSPNPALTLNVTAGQTATVIYNTTTEVIQGLMLNKSGQPVPTPKTPPAGIASSQGLVTVGVNNVITVALNPAPSTQLTAPSTAKATVVYDKTTGAIQALMSGRMGAPPMGIAPFARKPLNTNSANVQATLSLSGTSITVTPASGTSFSPGLNVPAGQSANIIYNSTTKAVQGIMLTKSGATLPMPKAPPANAFASVQGSVSVTGNVITIIPANLGLGLTVPANAKVTIVYNKTSGAIQVLMPNMMGMAPFAPGVRPNTSSANVQGTVGVSANVITITPTPAPSIALTATGTPNATIIYNSTTGAIQGLMLNKAGQPLPTPKTPPTGFAIVQATVSTDGKTITVTAPSTTPGLNVPSTAKINVIYNKTSGAVQGIMLGRMGMFPFAPGGMPGHGGIKPNTTGPSAPSAPAVPHRQPGPGRMPMHSTI